MSLQACADLVRRGDPDRFRAAMAAPVPDREALFPLYAFNVEVSRAPWLTAEPMIAEMRLQWWRDALEEIARGGPVRRHEVATPLAEVLDPDGVAILDALVDARRWDIYRDPFEDADDFERYLDATSGGLVWAAARALGAEPGAEDAYRAVGRAAGLAALFLAVPELEARGRKPLVDGRRDAVAALAVAGQDALRRGVRDGAVGPAVFPAWMTGAVLAQAAMSPGRVADGTLVSSEFARRIRLLRAAWTGRIPT